MDWNPKQEEEMRKEEERQRVLSLERRREREKAQTEVARVSLKRQKNGFGIGIADTDGHCLVCRLVRNEYYQDSATDAEDPREAPRLRLGDRVIKVGDTLVMDYFEAVTAIKATPEVLDLTVVRDPNGSPLKEWLRDRLYNRSKPLYYTAVVLLMVLALAAAGGLAYGVSLIPGPPPPQTPRHDYKFPFGGDTPGHPEPHFEERNAKKDHHAMLMRQHMAHGYHYMDPEATFRGPI